jgi:hypothetical protein
VSTLLALPPLWRSCRHFVYWDPSSFLLRPLAAIQLMSLHAQCRENQRFVHRWFLQNLVDRPPSRELLTTAATPIQSAQSRLDLITSAQGSPRAGAHLIEWPRDRELMLVVDSLCASSAASSSAADPTTASATRTPRSTGSHLHHHTQEAPRRYAADLTVVVALCEEHAYLRGLLPLFRHAVEQARDHVDQLPNHRYLTLLLHVDHRSGFAEWILSGPTLSLRSWQLLLPVAQSVLSDEPASEQGDQPTASSAASTRGITRELIASLLVRSLAGDQVLQLFGEYPFFVERLPFEVYQQILRRTGSKAERDQVTNALVVCVCVCVCVLVVCVGVCVGVCVFGV